MSAATLRMNVPWYATDTDVDALGDMLASCWKDQGGVVADHIRCTDGHLYVTFRTVGSIDDQALKAKVGRDAKWFWNRCPTGSSATFRLPTRTEAVLIRFDDEEDRWP